MRVFLDKAGTDAQGMCHWLSTSNHSQDCRLQGCGKEEVDMCLCLHEHANASDMAAQAASPRLVSDVHALSIDLSPLAKGLNIMATCSSMQWLHGSNTQLPEHVGLQAATMICILCTKAVSTPTCWQLQTLAVHMQVCFLAGKWRATGR